MVRRGLGDELEELRLFVEHELQRQSHAYLYAWVPVQVVPYVKMYGLLAGDALLRYPDVVKALSDALGVGAMSVRQRVNLLSQVLGPKVLFKPPPVDVELHPRHPSVMNGSVVARIDWTSLKYDHPDARLWGMQVDTDDPAAMHDRWLTGDEVSMYMSMSSSDLWSRYQGDPGFAAHVPHARIAISGSRIPPEYIEFSQG